MRLDEALDERLAGVAGRLGVTESDAIRIALERYCSAAEQEEQAADLIALVQQWQQEDRAAGYDKLPLIDTASHSGELYGEALWDNWLRRQEGDAAQNERRVAEGRAAYNAKPRPAAD